MYIIINIYACNTMLLTQHFLVLIDIINCSLIVFVNLMSHNKL